MFLLRFKHNDKEYSGTQKPDTKIKIVVTPVMIEDIGEVAVIHPHSTMKIPTNLAAEIPDGYFGAIYARSGIATKRGLRPSNCTGIIDSDYRGNVIVALHNDSEQIQTIEPDERIAQLIIQPCTSVGFVEDDGLGETDRGDGGFGSSGK